MNNSIKNIKEDLKKSYELSKEFNEEKGCCQISIGGSTTTRSNVTFNECERITNNYPGATSNFFPGRNCSEV